jgi:hypothetical protein
MKFENGFYHPPGVYFGMPEDEYHADCSLGSTDLRNLIVSGLQYYWYSPVNPSRKPHKDTQALRYGRAIHKCVLEGQDEFERFYARKPPRPTDGQLVTSDDLKQKCVELGISKSGTKATLIERILEMDPNADIYDVKVAQYLFHVGDRIILDDEDYNEIIMAADNIKANQHLQHAFHNGKAEVSVFWEQQGIPCKARFDYLKPRAVVDLKSTRNHLQQRWPVAVANFLARGRYEIQSAHYLNGRTVLPMLVDQGLVEGHVDKKWLQTVVDETNFQFVFVIYCAEGPPLTYAVIFTREEEDYDVANQMIDMAFDRYREGFAKYGTKEWIEAGTIEYWGNLDFPMWRNT